MMQLTLIELVPGGGYRQPGNGTAWPQELWNWRANIDTALTVLEVKRAYAENYLAGIAPDGNGGYIMPPTTEISGVEFQPNTLRTPDQIETIKRYNGGKFWLTYNPLDGTWTHTAIAGDYVEEVMDQYEP